MKIRNEIFQSLSDALNRIEQQAALLAFCDEASIEKQNIIIYLSHILQNMSTIANVEPVAIFVHAKCFIKDAHYLFGRRENVSDKVFKSFSENAPIFSYVQDDESSTAWPCITIRMHYDLVISMIWKDHYYGRQMSIFNSDHFTEYAARLASRIEQKLNNVIDSRKSETFKTLTYRFLDARMRRRRPKDEGSFDESGYEKVGWEELLAAIVNFLPTWGPFSFQGLYPSAQILTVIPGGSYLRLRTEAKFDPEKRDWRYEPSRKNLKRKKTVCFKGGKFLFFTILQIITE